MQRFLYSFLVCLSSLRKPPIPSIQPAEALIRTFPNPNSRLLPLSQLHLTPSLPQSFPFLSAFFSSPILPSAVRISPSLSVFVSAAFLSAFHSSFMAEPSYLVASDSEDTSSVPIGDAAIGIDLGSSHCSVAVWRNSQVEVLSNPRGLKRMPSHVLFRRDIPCSGVSSSISDADLASGSAIYNVKCLVGRMDTDQVVQNMHDCPFLLQTLDIGARPFLAALVNDVWRCTTPEEVLAIVLVELRAMAESQLGRMIRSVVLTMPASFSRFQQTRIERACAMAGLHVLRLMPEPTAAALLYAQQQQQANCGNLGSGVEKNALIFNMGACFCDVAIAATAGGVSQIKALSGESFGGENMVQNLIKYVLKEIDASAEEKLGFRSSKLSIQLRPIVERAIHALSSAQTADIEGEVAGKRISRTITREEFEHVNVEYFQKSEALVMRCLGQAQLDADSLSDIILVGGCSYIPRLRSTVQNICGGRQIYQGIDPLEAAVRGAAMEGAIASGLVDPLGKLDLLTIQAMPHSLGIRVAGDEFLPILQKNVTIPARKDITVTTSHDNQAEAVIITYEGESQRASENHLLGFFKLSGIPPAPKGVPVISVCMDVDASDVLRVMAGVCLPDAEKPVVSLVEVRMPTVDDGHGWCSDAIWSKYGSSLDVDLIPRPPLTPTQKK